MPAQNKKSVNFWWITSGLAIVAAILYSSWPLGSWLNPVVARGSLASGLEGVGQPYNWVFIGGDIVSSLLVLIVCWLLWRHYRAKRYQPLLAAVLLATVVFAIGTIVDAALPERCIPTLQRCPSFTQDHLLLWHGVFSILASVGLFFSLMLLWWRQRLNRILNLLMLGYILFGAVSLIEAVVPGKDGNWSQHYYITLCSVWLAVFPYALRHSLMRPASPAARVKRQRNLPLVIRLAENLWGA